jgi:hypothetical protein
MALSVATLAGFPAINTTFQRSAGTPTDAATYSFTNGVYTPGSSVYVAGILDQQGVNPSRIYFADNNTGGGTTGATVALPQLVSITQVSANGQSLAELPSNYPSGPSFNEYTPQTGYSGFIVLLNATPASADDGIYPLGYNNAVSSAGPANYANVPGWVSQGGAYTGTTTTGYPNPQMRYFVTFNALLVIASTSTG